MKNNTQRPVVLLAFLASAKGKFISAIEFSVLLVLSILLFTYFASKFDLLTLDHTIAVFELIFSAIFGLLFGSLGELSFFCWKIFPPNEASIKKYKNDRKKEIIQEISSNENKIAKLKDEYETLSFMIN